jgi:hypothetical protein
LYGALAGKVLLDEFADLPLIVDDEDMTVVAHDRALSGTPLS